MATLSIAATTVFSASVFNPLITTLDFDNLFFTPATATFVGAQFDNVHIANLLIVVGSAGINNIVINDASSFEAAGWTCTTWTVNDHITINGSAGADSLNGSSQNGTVQGGLGADTLRGSAGGDALVGGGGNDVFISDLAAGSVGDQFFGGSGGKDRFLVTNASISDLRTITVSGNEIVDFTSGSTLRLYETQVGAAALRINTFIGSSDADRIDIDGAAVDLSGLALQNWSAEDAIFIFGTGGTDVLIGSSR